MPKNQITPGESRLGWVFVSPESEIGEVSAMLVDKDSSIQLVLPLGGIMRDGAPHSRWWSHGIMHMDDPDRTRFSYAPPKSLVFHDTSGTVALVGCRSAGYRGNIGAGRGVVIANYAVLGGRSFGYGRVNGMRTEAPAIAAWTKITARSISTEKDERNRVRSLNLKLESPPRVSLARTFNLGLRVHWWTDPEPGSFTATEAVQVETNLRDARSWNDHLTHHSAMLDLVTIAGWQPFGFSRITVKLDSDVLESKFVHEAEPKWREVVTHRLPRQEGPLEKLKFLFLFNEIGPRGVKRWLALREEFYRMIDPLLGIVRSEEPWGLASVVQSGIALEALGYQLEISEHGGRNLNRYGGIAFNKGLRHILDDLTVTPFEDADGWIERANASYMGAKHPDRGDMPDTVDMANSLRENILVLRFWIAQRLGVSTETLASRLRSEPHREAFIAEEE